MRNVTIEKRNALVIVDAWKEHIYEGDTQYLWEEKYSSTGELIDQKINFPHIPILNTLDLINTLPKDMKAFGVFLNRVCELLRSRGTMIVHSISNRKSLHGGVSSGMMEEIKINKKDLVILSLTDLSKVLINDSRFDEIYFGGFFFGRCVHERARTIYPNGSIVLNLSMIFPSDSWTEQLKNHREFKYSLWNSVGFDNIKYKEL